MPRFQSIQKYHPDHLFIKDVTLILGTQQHKIARKRKSLDERRRFTNLVIKDLPILWERAYETCVFSLKIRF
jgi:hypothetical protein